MPGSRNVIRTRCKTKEQCECNRTDYCAGDCERKKCTLDWGEIVFGKLFRFESDVNGKTKVCRQLREPASLPRNTNDNFKAMKISRKVFANNKDNNFNYYFLRARWVAVPVFGGAQLFRRRYITTRKVLLIIVVFVFFFSPRDFRPSELFLGGVRRRLEMRPRKNVTTVVWKRFRRSYAPPAP